MRWVWGAVLVGLWGLLSGGCGSEWSDGKERVTLRVGVAASLGPWMEEFARAYEQNHPDVRFEISAGGSNVVTRQALAGAPLDIVLLASSDLMEQLDSAGRLLPGTRTVVGTNRLCLIVPEEGPAPEELSELTSPTFRRIAIGSPGVPAGDYAREALDRSRLTRRLTDRFIFGTNVRQVLAWVEAGEVDCGFVYLSDTVNAENIRVALLIDSTLHSPITYEAAALQAGKHHETARRMVRGVRIKN